MGIQLHQTLTQCVVDGVGGGGGGEGSRVRALRHFVPDAISRTLARHIQITFRNAFV